MARLTAHNDGAKAMQIQRQIVDIGVDIADMRATYVRMGERSDWTDERLDLLDEDIAFWEDRVVELRRQLERLERVMANVAASSPRSPLPAA